MALPNDIKVFADSNFFIGLWNQADGLYSRAKEISGKLESLGAGLVISNVIFLEIVTILSQRRSRIIATAAGNYILSDPRVRIVHIDENLHRASWDIFQATSRKNMSFVDCSIVAVMHAENIKRLLTFVRTDFSPMRKRYHFSFFE